MFKRILVPLDGSLVAERALAPAVALALAAKGELILLRVMEPVSSLAPYHVIQEWLDNDYDPQLAYERIERYLKSVRQVHAMQDLPISLQILEGDPAQSIVRQAAAAEVDLIVMSTHGRTGFTRWMLGSITEKVLQATACPVLAVRAEALPEKILVTLDGSALAEQVLAPALFMADAFASEMVLLRVQSPVELDDIVVDNSNLSTRALKAQLGDHLYREAEVYLCCLVREKMAGQKVKTAVRAGPVAHSILDYADDNGVDCIAMTTHGRAGLGDWTYGSIAKKVLDGAECSLLIMRPKLS